MTKKLKPIILLFIILSIGFSFSCSPAVSPLEEPENVTRFNGSENTSEPQTSTENTAFPDPDVQASDTPENVPSGANVFFMNSVATKTGEVITVTLSLTGEVEICRYSMEIDYDNIVLELQSYDEELSVLSPVVNPERDENGMILEDTGGKIYLEWARATNVTKAGKIIEMKFKVLDIAVSKTEIILRVKGVNKIQDSTVVEAECGIINSVITIN